jgi:asparagine synthetase B (glutamine-hydrolysing)
MPLLYLLLLPFPSFPPLVSTIIHCPPKSEPHSSLSPQYEEVGEDVASYLDGMFSFVLLDNKNNTFMAARDPIGITPLYMGWGRDGSVWFASEMKALTAECDQFQAFPPGHIYSSKHGK